MEVLPLGAPIDLTGKRYGRVTVVKEAAPHITVSGAKQRRWECVCDCGRVFFTTTQNLRSGDTKSCGCLKRELDTIKATTHGDSGTKLHGIWKAMRKRCRNANNADYKYYGGKGVRVCVEWDDYIKFKQWAMCNGYQDGLTIDRIDSAKDYCPENCRWVDFKTQCHNRTSNKLYTYHNETHDIAEWSQITQIKYSTLYMRLRSGKTIEEAIEYNPNK